MEGADDAESIAVGGEIQEWQSIPKEKKMIV